MSILQEFEKIRNQIGQKKNDMIAEYIKTIYNQEDYDMYFKEAVRILNLPPDQWNKKLNEVRRKYNIVLLDDILYKKEEWDKYNIWFNENYLNREVELTEVCIIDDIDYIYPVAYLYKEGQVVANIIDNFELSKLEENKLEDEEYLNRSIKSLIYDKYDSYLKLPKILECSKLLIEIYDTVCESESSMCYISDEDWEEYYSEKYDDKDIEVLKQEIKKYHLQDVIEIDNGEYKVLGYGDLQKRFNDNRSFDKNIIKNMIMENTGGYVMTYYGKLEDNNWYVHSDLDDIIRIYDKKPFDNDYYKDEYNWCNNHLVREVENVSAKEMFKRMNFLVDEVIKDKDYNKVAHDHFKEIINNNTRCIYYGL